MSMSQHGMHAPGHVACHHAMQRTPPISQARLESSTLSCLTSLRPPSVDRPRVQHYTAPNRPRNVGRHNAMRTPPRRGSYRVYLNAPTKTETHWDEARRGAHSQHHVSVVFGRPISDLDHKHIIKTILCLRFDI